MVNVNDFLKESECSYKNELYSVRDNGAVLRHSFNDKRVRPTDNNWTFGKLNCKTGYLEIASVTIHRIVASAFHGEPPTKEHVVDHIDTNKQNNRPENLRWVTRLENILLNPITAKRISYICGSIEEFLANPSQFRDKFQNPDYKWMATVSAEEAQISKERLLAWAESDKPLQGGWLREWLFKSEIVQSPTVIIPNYLISKTHNAAQRIITHNDKPHEYPSTPQAFEYDPLKAYHVCLKEGAPFFRNHNGEYIVVKSGFSTDKQTLYVMTKSNYVYRERERGDYIPVPIPELNEKISDKDLNFALTQITYEDGLFVHEKIETGFHPMEELEEIYTDLTKEI